MSTTPNKNKSETSEIKKIQKNTISADQLFLGIKNNEIAALGRAITLVESSNLEHKATAKDLIERCLSVKTSTIRVGVTGVPGVGKSTFIDTLGYNLTALGKKVAVLAVDPTSAQNKGSILGDKTRMEKLAQNPNAFIRPSPAGNTLGGVAQKTREAIIICEAAGYDIILIETVGVGQSEIAVHSMVDFYLVLKLSGAGDELQGIKRGILEMADSIVINKADGDNINAANKAAKEFSGALHLFPPKENGWTPQVFSCSAFENTGLENIWTNIENYITTNRAKGYIAKRRNEQNKFWLLQTIENNLIANFYKNKEIKKELNKQIALVTNGLSSPFKAADELLNLAKHSNKT